MVTARRGPTGDDWITVAVPVVHRPSFLLTEVSITRHAFPMPPGGSGWPCARSTTPDHRRLSPAGPSRRPSAHRADASNALHIRYISPVTACPSKPAGRRNPALGRSDSFAASSPAEKSEPRQVRQARSASALRAQRSATALGAFVRPHGEDPAGEGKGSEDHGTVKPDGRGDARARQRRQEIGEGTDPELADRLHTR